MEKQSTTSAANFDDLPVEIAVNIFTLLPVQELGRQTCLVCTKWYNILFKSQETLSPWRLLLQRDFGVSTKEGQDENLTWLQMYKNYAEWSWSSELKAKNIKLGNHNKKAKLRTDDTYQAVLTKRPVKRGTHYFEVTIEKAEKPEGRELGFGVGNPKLLTVRGWHQENNGVGWYSNGTCFIRGGGSPFAVTKWGEGDVLGVLVSVGQGSSWVQFYKNKSQVGQCISLVNTQTDPPYVACLLGYQQIVSIKYLGPSGP